jgi:hypothetical protein
VQKLLDFVVGDFVFGVQCLHNPVSLLALAVLDCDAGFVQEVTDGVAWCWCVRRECVDEDRKGFSCGRCPEKKNGGCILSVTFSSLLSYYHTVFITIIYYI